MDTQSNKKIKLSGKQEEDMKKPLSKIKEGPEAYRTIFNPPMYNEDLKHVNPQDQKVFDWEKIHNNNGIVPKPGCSVSYKPSAEALAIAVTEKERVAKRTAEEVFDQVFTLKNQ